MMDIGVPATRRALAMCGWSGPLTLVVALLGLLVAGVLPFPLGADTSADEVVDFYSGSSLVALGIAFASVGVCLVMPLAVGVEHIMRATEDRPLLSRLQLTAGSATGASPAQGCGRHAPAERCRPS